MQKCSETTNQEPESSLARLAKIFHIIKREWDEISLTIDGLFTRAKELIELGHEKHAFIWLR